MQFLLDYIEEQQAAAQAVIDGSSDVAHRGWSWAVVILALAVIAAFFSPVARDFARAAMKWLFFGRWMS